MSQDQIDLFGAIGAQSRINAGAGLVPVPAAAIPTKRLRAGGIDPAAVRPAHVAPSGTAWLEHELDQLTRQHARFLREVAPPAPTQRRRIALREWQWRLGTDADDFAALNGGTGDWQTVTVPHYAGPLGRATTWYRREIQLDREWFTGSAPWLVLRGVDYRAIVYLNGAAAATHEGAFAPIEVDGRRWLKPGRNVLLIQVENDLVSTGNDSWGSPLDGPKLYAATGPGFDDPDQGWRHCPPGMGIWQEAFVEARPDPHIADIFVRVLDHTGQIEAWIEIHRAAAATGPVNLELEVHGLNHRAVRVVRLKHQPTTPAGPGPTQYRIPLTIPRAKSWTPAEPWLYRCDVRLVDEAGASLDAASRAFGLRTFVLDQTRLPRNRPLLNGREIRLRGSNTMGFEQLRVIAGERDGLIRDLLTTKALNLNFLRLTQRPVQDEVYAMCDRLGILLQTDLPLFGKLPRAQWAEAVRQAGEMERLVRAHPSVVKVSFINEPFPPSMGLQLERVCTRGELEEFLHAAASLVHIVNPDRAVKHIDGDYFPPGPGMPDYHLYSTWYLNHGLELGRVIRGEWMPSPPDTCFGCGEFGSEGLDAVETARKRYPARWLPQTPEEDAAWTPNQMHVPGWARLPESGNYHHFWYESPRGLAAWVEASQRHQAWAVLTVADAMRRQDRLVSCAVHLLIDNFPSGMMFALVDVERQPKPAFFALREAFAPLALSWRSDRTGYYAGEPLAAELWLADDTGEPPATVQVRWRLRVAGKVVIAQHFTARPQALKATALGLLAAKAPAVDAPQDAVLEAELIIGGKGVQSCSQAFRIWPRPATIRTRIGTPGGAGPARRLVAELGLPSVTCGAAKAGDTILVDSPEVLKKHSKALLAAAERGARVVVLGLPIGNHEILGHQLEIVEAGFGLRHFVSRDTGHPWVAGLAPGDIRLWHDGPAGRITPLLDKLILPADGWQPVLISGRGGWGMNLSLAYACAERSLGKGHLVICQVDLAGRTATNPAARTLADALLGAPNPFINPT